MTPASLAILLLLLPLGSAALIGLFLRRQGALASWISVARRSASAFARPYALIGEGRSASR